MSVAVIKVTSMTVAVIPIRSRNESVGAKRPRSPRGGGAGSLHRAWVRPDDGRGDRRTRRVDRANVLPALRRQTGGVVRGTGRADPVGHDAHSRSPRLG